MSRIAETFAKQQKAGKKGFIPFLTAGDPDLETTCELLIELARAGATVIELGVPFSDPMADGPVIQRASERALKHGFGVAEVLDTVAMVRPKIDTPLILFSYFNPLMRFGINDLVRECKRVGIDGMLVTDLAVEESGELSQALRARELDMIYLVAPTSTDTRLKMVAERASGFIYAVSRPGVTGTREDLSSEAERLVSRMRKFSHLPVAVGFGISNSKHVLEVWRYADAVVVGSAIVEEIEQLAGRPDLTRRVGQFAREITASGA